MDGDTYSFGPPFSALAVPEMKDSQMFRGPAARAYRHGSVTGIKFGEHHRFIAGEHQAVTQVAVIATPGLGTRIDITR